MTTKSKNVEFVLLQLRAACQALYEECPTTPTAEALHTGALHVAFDWLTCNRPDITVGELRDAAECFTGWPKYFLSKHARPERVLH